MRVATDRGEPGGAPAQVLAGPQSTITGRERLDAFRRGLAAHCIELAEGDMLIGDFTQESGERAMDELLARPRLPSALFAADNPMALGALRRIRWPGCRSLEISPSPASMTPPGSRCPIRR